MPRQMRKTAEHCAHTSVPAIISAPSELSVVGVKRTRQCGQASSDSRLIFIAESYVVLCCAAFRECGSTSGIALFPFHWKHNTSGNAFRGGSCQGVSHHRRQFRFSSYLQHPQNAITSHASAKMFQGVAAYNPAQGEYLLVAQLRKFGSSVEEEGKKQAECA